MKISSFLCLFLILLLGGVGCSKKPSHSSKKKKENPLADLKEEVARTRNYNKTIRVLRARLYTIGEGKHREQIQQWIKKLEKKQKKRERDVFRSFSKRVDQLVDRGDVQGGLFQLNHPSEILKKTTFIEKIAQRIYDLKSQEAIYTYTGSLLKKAKKMADNRKYTVALAILDTFDDLTISKPAKLVAHVQSLRKEISRKKSAYQKIQAKLARLPWYMVIRKDDLYNWNYKPLGREFWDVRNFTLEGKGSGSGENASWAVLLTISKDNESLDNIESEEMRDYICEFQFKIKEGRGFDFWARVVRDENKLNALAISSSKFKANFWYTIRVEVRGDKIHLFCPTNLYEQESYAKSSTGTVGFMIYENTKILVRNFKIKIIPQNL